MRLYGKNWTRRELEARVGAIEQICGVQRMRLTEGKQNDVEWIQVRTGSGLTYYVVPSKGLDISFAEMSGTPISWRSPNGDCHPAYYEPSGFGWLRTASGGLLMTCGLMNVGTPGKDEFGQYGMHGRVHHSPARHVCSETVWNEDELEIRVSGVVQETAIFRGKLRMYRTIASRLGENRISITDQIENIGFCDCPHMMLYHFNLGFPLLAEEMKIQLPKADSAPVTPFATVENHDKWEAPETQATEQVYYHDLHDDDSENGMCDAIIFNPRFPVSDGERPLTVKLRWLKKTLPRLVQWRMPGAGEYVLGLEPANCGVEGRQKERRKGTLRMLEAGESIHYKVELILT